MGSPPPPPSAAPPPQHVLSPVTVTRLINYVLREYIYYKFMIAVVCFLMLLLMLWHVGQAIFKRLWLLPSHASWLLAPNATTVALIGLVVKPAMSVSRNSSVPLPEEVFLLACTVLISAVVGALMPSVAASVIVDLRAPSYPNLSDVRSNVIGAAMLIIPTNFIIFLQFFYMPDDSSKYSITKTTANEHKCVMASLFLLLLVLLVQALALVAMISDVKTIVLEQLEQLSMEAKPGYKPNASMVQERPAWSWEVVKRNAFIKLMMVVTSNPQHLITRSPSAAIVGALVLFCNLMLSKAFGGTPFCFPMDVQYFLRYHDMWDLVLVIYEFFLILCLLICVWRWARVALQEDRSFLSLLSHEEPSYWRRKVCNMLKASAPSNVSEEGHYGFKAVVGNTTDFLMLCFVVPSHRLLVAMIRYTHILSSLFMQRLIWPPLQILQSLTWPPLEILWCGVFTLVKPLLGERRVVESTATQPFENFDSGLGVICLEGEDARIVRREFVGPVNRIIGKQLKRAKTKYSDLKALIDLLQTSKNTSSRPGESTSCIHDVLHQDSAPYVENLHVEHGYQYGWSLMIVSLLAVMTKIEVEVLETSEMSEVAKEAVWQAMEMMQVIDEQFVPCIVCSKETYASASASEWSKLPEKKRRCSEKRKQVMRAELKLDVVDQVLKAILKPIEEHMKHFNKKWKDIEDFNKTGHVHNIAAAWPLETVVSYTMHTVCRSLLRWWTDLENARVANNLEGGGAVEEEANASEIIQGMVKHINVLIGEVLACCLSNLPTALDMSMTDAVLSGSVTKTEKGLFLIGQGKYLWKKLEWPTLYSTTNNGPGQLRHWIHLAENACAS